MSSYKIYTRKTRGLDNRVWRLMLVMIVVPLALLSYRLMDNEKCRPFSIAVKTLGLQNNVFYTGETLSFTASANSKDIDWNFGDNTGTMGAGVHHQYLKEGAYLVTASGRSLCETEILVTIKNRPVIIQLPDSIEGSIIGPRICYAFTEQTFIFGGSARSYEWTVPNHPSLGTKTGQNVTYTFLRPGRYTIQVELNHDRTKRFNYDFLVEEEMKNKNQANGNVERLIKPEVPIIFAPRVEEPPAPLPKQEEKDTTAVVTAPAVSRKSIHIADNLFLNYLEEVISKKMTASDFDKYLCYGGGTPVIVNGDKREIKTFNWLCEKISGGKKKKMIIFKDKIKVESAKLYRENGCVTRIDVQYN